MISGVPTSSVPHAVTHQAPADQVTADHVPADQAPADRRETVSTTVRHVVLQVDSGCYGINSIPETFFIIRNLDTILNACLASEATCCPWVCQGLGALIILLAICGIILGAIYYVL